MSDVRKHSLSEIEESITFMRRRLESGYGDRADSLCRLSLTMSEQLLAMAVGKASTRELIDALQKRQDFCMCDDWPHVRGMGCL